MSSKRTSAIMNSSRPRTSVEATRKSRTTSRTQPDPVSSLYSSYPVSSMTHASFSGPSGSQDFYTEVPLCWSMMSDSFLTGNDSAHIPTLSVAPTQLTNPSGWDSMARYEIDSSSASSGPSSDSSISPPMSGTDMLHVDMYPSVDQYGPYHDQWVNDMPMTPPEDHMFDNLELFGTNKNESMMFPPLPEPATECEYLGVSKLQFSSAPVRHSQPRAIRSASERGPTSSSSGSQHSRHAKDDHVERVKNNPRNDPRYEEKADKDGYYHCPYAAEGCNHKPTKQKCIYAKNLDSHLKPYTCKFGAVDENCRSLRFSSNACLFRHEREMHGLHNHGINPYLCKFPGCERARSDNGFPRRWNQRDHMKRVHGYEEPESDEGAERGYADSSSRRKKSTGASHHVPMKRTGSSRAQHNYYPGASRTAGAPRYNAQAARELQARNIMISGMNSGEMSFAPQQVMNQAYGNYVQTAY